MWPGRGGCRTPTTEPALAAGCHILRQFLLCRFCGAWIADTLLFWFQGQYHSHFTPCPADLEASNSRNSLAVLYRIGYRMARWVWLPERETTPAEQCKLLTRDLAPVSNGSGWGFGSGMPMGGGGGANVPQASARQIGGNVSFAQSLSASQPATPLDPS